MARVFFCRREGLGASLIIIFIVLASCLSWLARNDQGSNLQYFRVRDLSVLEKRPASKHDVWQPAGDGSDGFVFSAYLDRRKPAPVIRIIGISKHYKKYAMPDEYCMLWFLLNSSHWEPEAVLAHALVVPENHDRQ
jgi:hypothetical protein